MRLDFCQATLFLRVCSGWFCMWVVCLYIAARDSFFFRHILLLLLLLMSRSLSPPFNRKTHYGRIALFTCAIFILAPYTNGTMKIAHTQTDIHTHNHHHHRHINNFEHDSESMFLCELSVQFNFFSHFIFLILFLFLVFGVNVSLDVSLRTTPILQSGNRFGLFRWYINYAHLL